MVMQVEIELPGAKVDLEVVFRRRCIVELKPAGGLSGLRTNAPLGRNAPHTVDRITLHINEGEEVDGGG